MDFIKLGMMKAEFDEACRQIDERATQESQRLMQSAYKALLAGKPSRRDRLCDKAETVIETVRAAKTEAWLRIGEKYGFDRDEAELYLAQMRAMN